MKKELLFSVLLICLFCQCREDVLVEDLVVTEEITSTEYEDYLKTNNQDGTYDIYVKCTARKTDDETLISAIDTTSNKIVVIGIKGFEPGNYYGNVLGLDEGSETGEEDLSQIRIDEYDDKGGKIKGTFISGNIDGDFVAFRIR